MKWLIGAVLRQISHWILPAPVQARVVKLQRQEKTEEMRMRSAQQFVDVSSSVPSAIGPAPTRRGVLIGGAALVGYFFIGNSAYAVQDALSVASDESAFLRLSIALTGHRDLDGKLAQRLFSLLREAHLLFAGKMEKLAVLAESGGEPHAILARADEAGFKQIALSIVAAWYTGSAADAMNAPMAAYRDALMYWPTRDGLPAPTYCFNRPGWWAEDPPPLGIPATAPGAVEPPAPPPTGVLSTPKPAQTEPRG